MVELKLLYSTVNLNFMKWLWVWIVDFDSENDRNIKQENSNIEWTSVCWLGSSQWSNLLCSSSYDGSKGLATCKLSCTLLKKVRPEIDDESDNDCEDVVCKDCLDYKAQVQNLKDDVAELHKEILKLRRQKRLITKSYELEIAELNKKIKNNELEQRYNSLGINIIINSER